MSLAYEADTPSEVFPDAEIVWLDEGRDITPYEQVLANYAERRLSILQPCLPSQLLSRPIDDILATISCCIWRQADEDSAVDERDAIWAEMLLDRLAHVVGGWTAVIVGATHASNRQGTLRAILEGEGIPCTVDILRPSDK